MSYYDDPDKLQTLDVPRLSQKDCPNRPNSTNNMICAGYLEVGLHIELHWCTTVRASKISNV